MARARRSGNLPAEVTSFIGRRRDLAELRKALATSRLVSLVGPGGVGKTRLAIRIGLDLARGFPGGAWLVELAEVQDSALVPNAVLAALGLRDQAASEPLDLLVSYLRDKELLLLVDNCEHLLAASARLVTEILKAASGVRVIATSREPLSVSGEDVIPIAPLELPAPEGAEPLSHVRQNEAIMLFTARAASASGKFELTISNQTSVVDLCRRLDGLPLAIELAAVRTRVLSVEQIRDRLVDRFGLLTGGSRAALPRHQTLRTTIDWSHDLLGEHERMLFRRLSAFASRISLEDVESVCASSDLRVSSVLDLLSSLVDKSLVMKVDARRAAGYRLHETMREYARLKLREAGEEEDVQGRCVEYYRSMCHRSLDEPRSRLLDWLEWMDAEVDNVRSVLQRCLIEGDSASGIDIAGSLGWYWITRATTEGARWLDDLLASGRGHPAHLAQAYFVRGFLAMLQVDPTAAKPVLDRAIAIARESQQIGLLSQSLSVKSITENMTGDGASARRLLQEAQVLATGLDDPAPMLALLQARSFNGFFEGDLEAVKSASSQCADLSRKVGDHYTLEYCLINLGFAALITGDLDHSKSLFVEGLQIARQIDDRVAQYYLLSALGCHAAGSNHARLAAHLLGAAETIRTGAGASVNALIGQLVTQAEQSATLSLGASAFEAEFKAGKRLSREAASALGLGEPSRIAAAVSDDPDAGLLGKRESDVARLVAEGLSNKQIGVRLFISERTVESHVRNILNKLGFNSRAQIASWIGTSN